MKKRWNPNCYPPRDKNGCKHRFMGQKIDGFPGRVCADCGESWKNFTIEIGAPEVWRKLPDYKETYVGKFNVHDDFRFRHRKERLSVVSDERGETK